MKTTNWKDIAELLGIGAIVASLIFVGLEMRQSQRIAVAAQYHERTSIAVEWYLAQYDNSDLDIYRHACSPELPPGLSIEQANRACITLSSLMTISDNHLYQYQEGFLDEESWIARRKTIKAMFRLPQARFLVLQGGNDYRESFIELGRTLVREIEAEGSE